MDWLNIHRSTLAAEAFLGCEPVQRATWLCLLAYCADQENGGKIEGAEEWGDRKWQQVVRITKSEAHDICPLWSWSEGVLTVWAYPVEKEEEVRRNRTNGGKGGRPPKPVNNQVVSSGLPSGLPSGLTETETQTEPSAPISAETEGKEKGIGKEGERKEKKAPKVAAPSEAEWVAYCSETWPDWHPQSSADSWAYYESVGWRTRAGALKDWRSAARTAHSNAREWGKLQPANVRGEVSAPTLQEWLTYGQEVATANRTRGGATWPKDLGVSAYHQCAASGWKGIADWKAKLSAECLRWVGTQNGMGR